MKNSFLFLFLAVGLGGCPKSNSPGQNLPTTLEIQHPKLGEPFTLAVTRSAVFDSDTLQITLDGMVADSRCPKGVECIQAGRVDISLMFVKSGDMARRDTIGIGSGGSRFPDDISQMFGRTVKLLEVSPVPEANKSIPASDYRVKIVVN